MEIIRITNCAVEISLCRQELITLSNALNEVRNGIEILEFGARLGVTHEEADRLFISLRSLIDQVSVVGDQSS